MKVYDRSTDEDKRRQRRGRRSKDKGGRFEKEVEKAINHAFNDEGTARRGFKSDIDVEVLDSEGRLAFNIECKCGKRVNIRKAFRQAQEKRRAASIPIGVWKDDGAPNDLYAVIDIDLLIEFMRLYLRENK